MNVDTLFKISMGLYITGARDENNRLIGHCMDAVVVAEIDPPQVILSLNKGSYTAHQLIKTGRLSLSILPQNIDPFVIENFGMQTSKTQDKWDVVPHHLIDDLPVLDNAIAAIILNTEKISETTGHFIFLGTATNIVDLNDLPELTYNYYQQNTKEKTP